MDTQSKAAGSAMEWAPSYNTQTLALATDPNYRTILRIRVRTPPTRTPFLPTIQSWIRDTLIWFGTGSGHRVWVEREIEREGWCRESCVNQSRYRNIINEKRIFIQRSNKTPIKKVTHLYDKHLWSNSRIHSLRNTHGALTYGESSLESDGNTPQLFPAAFNVADPTDGEGRHFLNNSFDMSSALDTFPRECLSE
jgi:hypothetical protein